jgi:hypothetical protein
MGMLCVPFAFISLGARVLDGDDAPGRAGWQMDDLVRCWRGGSYLFIYSAPECK